MIGAAASMGENFLITSLQCLFFFAAAGVLGLILGYIEER